MVSWLFCVCGFNKRQNMKKKSSAFNPPHHLPGPLWCISPSFPRASNKEQIDFDNFASSFFLFLPWMGFLIGVTDRSFFFLRKSLFFWNQSLFWEFSDSFVLTSRNRHILIYIQHSVCKFRACRLSECHPRGVSKSGQKHYLKVYL